MSASVTGDLGKYGVKFPTANSGLAVVFGGEYRSEAGQLQPDAENISNDLTGNGNPILPLAASFHVGEFFTEERLPDPAGSAICQGTVLRNRLSLFRLHGRVQDQYLQVRCGLRPGFGRTPAGKLPACGAGAKPQGAVHPKVHRQRFGFRPLCHFLGKPPDRVGGCLCAYRRLCRAIWQYRREQCRTVQRLHRWQSRPSSRKRPTPRASASFFVTPTILPGLNFALDYFHINVKNVINSYGASYTINQCLTNGDSQFCDLVHRDATGSLWLSTSGYVDDPTLNLGSLQTRGADFTGATTSTPATPASSRSISAAPIPQA